MRYFRIYNQNVTKTRPMQEIGRSKFNECIFDYVEDVTAKNSLFDDDNAICHLFKSAHVAAKTEEGLDCGDFYLYAAGDDKSVLDFARKTS